MNLDDRIHSLTTIIDFDAQGLAGQGTGFFYHVLGNPVESAAPGWQPVESNWVITNKHVLLPEGRVPDKLAFRLRTVPVDGGVSWVNVEIGPDQLRANARLHPDPDVDVAGIDITKDVQGLFQKQLPLTYSAVGESEFPGANRITAEVTTDVVVVGYPKGFYDKVNKFPVVKTGIVASKWGAAFEGKPAFLIDAKLFPGSSGSVVISKPTDLVVEEGRVYSNTQKNYCLLGIFSGAYSVAGVDIDLGLVWYYSVIPQILSDGITLGQYEQSLASVPTAAAAGL